MPNTYVKGYFRSSGHTDTRTQRTLHWLHACKAGRPAASGKVERIPDVCAQSISAAAAAAASSSLVRQSLLGYTTPPPTAPFPDNTHQIPPSQTVPTGAERRRSTTALAPRYGTNNHSKMRSRASVNY